MKRARKRKPRPEPVRAFIEIGLWKYEVIPCRGMIHGKDGKVCQVLIAHGDQAFYVSDAVENEALGEAFATLIQSQTKATIRRREEERRAAA